MKSLSQFFIKNSFIVNVTSILVVTLGIVSLFSMKRGLMTSWNSGTIVVDAYVEGATPAEMERYVTFPIEQAIKSLEGVSYITSRSQDGKTRIRVKTHDDFLEYTTLEDEIRSKIQAINYLFPADIRDISVEHRKKTEQWLGAYAFLNFDEENDEHQRWISGLKERLLRLSGVVNVYTRYRTKSMYVRFKPEELSRYRINLTDAYSRVRQAFRLNPIGGFRKGGNQFFVQMINQSTDISQIKSIVVKGNFSGKVIRLGDIAEVEFRLPEKKSDFLVNGKKNASFFMMADVDSDLLVVRDRLEKQMTAEKKKFPTGIEAVKTGDGSAFIERQINALKTNSIYGAILVFLVLCVSLGMKNSLMTSFGIPLAYGATFIVLDMMGINIDLVSIIGMLLVLGILVDDSIIISEKHTQYLEQGENSYSAALKAVLSMWIPITGTVLTTIAAFAPFLVGHDQISVMMRAIPIVIVTALLASLFECFFILPNHLAHFVKKAKSEKTSKVGSFFVKAYRVTLAPILKMRYLFILSFLGFSFWSFYFAKDNLATNFNMNINEETVSVAGAVKNTTGAEDTLRQLQPVVDSLQKMERSMYKHYTVQVSGIWLQGRFKEGTEYFFIKVIFSQLDNDVAKKKDYVENYLKERMDSYKKLGVFKRIEISRQIEGDDEAKKDSLEVQATSGKTFDTQEVARSLEKTLKGTKGVKSIDLDAANRVETWEFEPNDATLISYGLTRAQLGSQLRAYVSLTNIYEYRGSYDLFTIYGLVREGSEQTYDSLAKIPILLSNGNMVLVSDLGVWRKKFVENVIQHIRLKKYTDLIIPFDKKEITEAALLKTLKEKVKTVKKDFPDIDFKVRNADEQVRKNKVTMSKKFLYSVVAIFFILCAILRSFYQPVLICMSIPFGLVGVIWAFYAQGLTFGIMAAIGVIGMAGVVVNDALILVNTVNEMRVSWSTFSSSILQKACATRLRPILLTSITTLGGLFPMAYGLGGDSGFTKPLAMSMAWGLLFATLLTLYLIPAFIMIQSDFMKLFFRLKCRFAIGGSGECDEVKASDSDNKAQKGGGNNNLRQDSQCSKGPENHDVQH